MRGYRPPLQQLQQTVRVCVHMPYLRTQLQSSQTGISEQMRSRFS